MGSSIYRATLGDDFPIYNRDEWRRKKIHFAIGKDSFCKLRGTRFTSKFAEVTCQACLRKIAKREKSLQ